MPGSKLSRRGFLSGAVRLGAGVGSGLPLITSGALARLFCPAPASAAEQMSSLVRQAPVARHWIGVSSPGATCASCHEEVDDGGDEAFTHETPVVRCLLCPHECRLAEGERGRCRSRANVNGELRTLVYGRPISQHVDPIEKKPFYHFLPGANAYSLATSGCPLRCTFCQNWQISQANPEDYRVPFTSAEEMAARAQSAQGHKIPVIAFTYNEPTVFLEYLVDIARLARAQGQRCVMISCGFVNEEPMREVIEVLDGIKIDLKGFDPEFYRKVSGAELEPVLQRIQQVARAGRHLELVNLVIPTLNDSEEKLTELAKWVVGELGPDVPVHFTRFHPDYQLRNLPPTPVATLERAREIAMDQGMHYAYVGNVPGHPGNNTYCPTCGECIIERRGFFVNAMQLENGRCSRCKTEIAGVWN